jgi:hypothetical protein
MRKCVLALAVLAIATAAAPAQGWAEKMFVDGQLSHNFGTVPKGAQLVHRFTVKNIWAVRLEITSIKSGCGCVSASATKRVLEPHETAVIEVRMDGRRFTGAKTVGVRVTVGPEYISSAELKISATSRADIVFNPGEVSFGTVTLGETPTQNINLEYAGNLPWQVSEVASKDLPYTTSLKELYRRPGQVGYRLAVTLKPDAPLGALKHDIFLKTNDPASPQVSVLVEANVQAPVTVSPSVLSLGTIKTDTPLIRRVVVRGNKPFRVTAVEGTGAGVELAAALAAAEAEVQLVTFKCQFDKPGPFKQELKIRTTLQNAPVVVTIDGSASK